MTEKNLFQSHNNYSSRQKQGVSATRETRHGFCVAASCIWIANVLKGMKPGSAKPNMALAGPLQVRYRWGNGCSDGTIAVLKHLNVKGDYIGNAPSRIQMLNRLNTHPGLYEIEASGHAIAMLAMPGQHMYYDVARGLYSYDDLNEMRVGLAIHIPDAVGTTTGWRVILCDT